MTQQKQRPTTIIADLRSLPKPVFVVCAAVAAYRAVSFVQFFIVLHGIQIGLGAIRAGVLLTAYGAVSVIGVSIGGQLISRIGPKRSMGLTMICSGVLVGLIPFTNSFGLLLAACASAGLTSQIYRPAASTLIAMLAESETLVTASAAFRLATNLGTAVGPIIGAGLLVWSPFALFESNCVTAIVLGLVVLTKLSTGAAPEQAGGDRSGLRTAIRDRYYLLFVSSVFLTAIAEVQLTSVLPLTVQRHGLPTVAYGLLLALNAILIITIELPLTGYVKRLSIRLAVSGGTAAMAIGMGIFGLADGIITLLVAMVIWTLGEIICSPSMLTYGALAAPPRMQSGYITLLWACQGAGAAVGPVIGTTLFATMGTRVWLCFFAICATGVVTAWFGVRQTTGTIRR